MTREIQRLKKQLLMEELSRRGKKPKYYLWLLTGVALLIVASLAFVWYQANLEDILENSFQEGLSLKTAGHYEKSIKVLWSLCDAHPQFHRAPAALLEVAETQEVYLGQYRDALLTYLLVERDYPETEQARLAQRQVAYLYKYRLDDCSQAIAAYQSVLDVSEERGDQIQYEVADCYFRLNNFEQARIEFEGLQKKYPESLLSAEVQYRIAVTYALDGKLPEAAAAYRLVMERWPENSYSIEARFGLAAVLEEQEELREALRILEQLVGVYPNPEVLNRKINQVRSRIDKKKKAI